MSLVFGRVDKLIARVLAAVRENLEMSAIETEWSLGTTVDKRKAL